MWNQIRANRQLLEQLQAAASIVSETGKLLISMALGLVLGLTLWLVGIGAWFIVEMMFE